MKATKADIPTPNQYLADLQKEEAEQGLARVREIAEEYESLLSTWLVGVNNQIKSILKDGEVKSYDKFIAKLLIVLDKGLEWANEIDALPEDIYHNQMVKQWFDMIFLATTVESFDTSYSSYKKYIVEVKKEIKQQLNDFDKLTALHTSEIVVRNNEIKNNAKKLLALHTSEINAKNSEIEEIWSKHKKELSSKTAEVNQAISIMQNNSQEISLLQSSNIYLRKRLKESFFISLGLCFLVFLATNLIFVVGSWIALAPLLVGLFLLVVEGKEADVL